jgi:hypothetical protein
MHMHKNALLFVISFSKNCQNPDSLNFVLNNVCWLPDVPLFNFKVFNFEQSFYYTAYFIFVDFSKKFTQLIYYLYSVYVISWEKKSEYVSGCSWILLNRGYCVVWKRSSLILFFSLRSYCKEIIIMLKNIIVFFMSV